jgi:FkbM family methyltransferase
MKKIKNAFINRLIGLVAFIKRLYVYILNIKTIIYQIYSIKIKLDLSKDVDNRLFYYGFEKDIIKYYRKILKKDLVVFDIGANIGIYSLIAANRIGINGRVYAFEPADIAYMSLVNNIELNKFDNISVNKMGVSDHTGTAIFNVCEDDAYNSLGAKPMKEIVKTETIKLVSIDNFVATNNIRKIDVIKVDTEGAEYLVFKGAEKTLRRDMPTLFFEYNPLALDGFENNPDDLIDYVRSLGYSLFEFVNYKLIEIKKENKILGNDIIAIKK